MGTETCKELALEGERLCQMGDFKEAISFFEAAIKLGTTDSKLLSSIYTQLGNAYFILANNEKVLDLTKCSLPSSPRVPQEPKSKDALSSFDYAMLNFTNDLSHSVAEKQVLRRTLIKPRPHTIHIDTHESSLVVPETELMREIVFAFQGLEGRILVQDPNNDGRYKVNPQYSLPAPTKQLVLRLTNIGWLFNKINKYCKYISKAGSYGHVCQSFAAALDEEISLYYRLITVIEQQLHFSSMSENDGTGITLLRLQLFTFDSLYCLKMLALLVEKCKNKRGGALLYVVHQFMQHGDPLVRECMTRILRQVVIPVRQMLSQWIFHGELEDNYKEFFVSLSRSDLSSPGDSLWHEKYTINKSMFPGFITMKQARMILATGKAVNLLKQIGQDAASVSGYEELKRLFENTKVELLFNDGNSSSEKNAFQDLLKQAYKETSQRALKLLFEDYHFMKHLRGLRLFLLLGQGDFIRHLMDVLEPELEKPADKLKQHTLANMLSSAIRSTNAQFYDEGVLDRVDVKLPENTVGGDVMGWDVFTLTYQTKGAISTILTPQCMNIYSTLFKHLWRSKRMEHILASIWKHQVVHARDTKVIAKLGPVFHSSQILLSEMMHFIQQMQYYVEFEVMECTWDELLKKIANAKDIDGLVDAHEYFLNSVKTRLMLDAESQVLLDQLRAIYDVIVEFQGIIEGLWSNVDKELILRKRYSSHDQNRAEQERRTTFENETIPKFRSRIQFLAQTYQDMVQKFLLLLADHTDANLRFLSFRLDFNEHYKRRNKNLETSFTYSRHRYSADNSLASNK